MSSKGICAKYNCFLCSWDGQIQLPSGQVDGPSLTFPEALELGPSRILVGTSLCMHN